MKPLRAVTYARVSTEKKSQQTSIRRQVAELKDVARLRRWNVVGQYSDRMSGGRDDRVGLRAALDLIGRGAAEVLVVHDLDRLGRNVRELLANVDAIHGASGQLFIVSLNIDTSTPEGRLTFTISGALAEFERRNTVRKVLAGIAYARKKGVRFGRPRVIEGAALARAAELRRKRPRPSWRLIGLQLQAEKLGRFKVPTIAWAVSHAKEGPRKALSKSPRKKPMKQGMRRARSAPSASA